MTDVVGNPEEERRADFFHLPWSQEAVCRYFYGKVNNGRLTLMVVKLFSGAFLWENPNPDFWSKITRIMVYQRNRRIHSG